MRRRDTTQLKCTFLVYFVVSPNISGLVSHLLNVTALQNLTKLHFCFNMFQLSLSLSYVSQYVPLNEQCHFQKLIYILSNSFCIGMLNSYHVFAIIGSTIYQKILFYQDYLISFSSKYFLLALAVNTVLCGTNPHILIHTIQIVLIKQYGNVLVYFNLKLYIGNICNV